MQQIYLSKQKIMLTAVKGFYENGQVILSETPPVTEKTEVIVTFLPVQGNNGANRIRLGSLEGLISVPDDFNEPLDELKEYT